MLPKKSKDPAEPSSGDGAASTPSLEPELAHATAGVVQQIPNGAYNTQGGVWHSTLTPQICSRGRRQLTLET